MTDEELVKQALAELGDVVRCRCHEAYKGRGLHDPDCQCDSAEALATVTKHIEALTAERDEHWKSFVHWRKEADALTEQLEAARADAKEAEAYAEELERDLKTCHMAQAVMDNTVTGLEAKLAKAVEALDGLLEAITATTQHGDRSLTITGPTANLKWLLETEEEARATLAEIEGEKG
jgi:chromosome segregation ATPase